MLVQFSGVYKSYGAQSIIQNATFQINPGEKIGLIGSNGSGKTTLLRILGKQLEPDGGVVHRRNGLRTGTLEQIPDFHDATTVLEEALRSFEALTKVEQELQHLEHEMANHSHPEFLDRYATLQHEFEHQGGYRFRSLTETALLGVGFTRDKLNQDTRSLSGGEKNRLALAKLLLSEAELLLLDEPTNHLDIRSIEWLEKFLNDTPKTVVVVSHDRIFLDRVVRRILEIDRTRVSDYPGNYSAYAREREQRMARQQKEWALQQQWIADQEDYIRRNLAGQKTKQAQSRRKLLARVQRIEKPATDSDRVKFRFKTIERGSRHVLRTEDLAIGYDKPLLENLQFRVERGERWAILGANGSGKTTLLRTLTGEIPPISGLMESSDGLEAGYYDQQLSGLSPSATVMEEMRSLDIAPTDEELRSWLAMFLFSGDDVFKSVSDLSGGEKSRLALAKIIYQSPPLLALDEPTNHLDIASREALEAALVDFPGTILFVTHDRYLTQKIASHLLYIEGRRGYTFDQLSAFEEWLAERPRSSQDSLAVRTAAERNTGLSKNRLDKLKNDAARIEKAIAQLESELKTLEQEFESPPPGMDWQLSQRRHTEIHEKLEEHYGELADRWKELEP